MSTCKCSCRVSVRYFRWISHEGAAVLHHIEGQLDILHYEHILQNVLVPSVRMFSTVIIIHLQQDHSSFHDSRVVQVWLSLSPFQEIAMSYGPLCQTREVKLLRLRVTFDKRLSP